jgi:hypothetical protein
MRTVQEKDEMGGTWSTHGELINSYNVFVGKPEETNHSEDLDVDG